MSSFVDQMSDAASSVGGRVRDWVRDNGRNVAIGGAGGAALAGGASMMTPQENGESPAERRRRILRNAMMGGVFGGGAGATIPGALDILNKAMPPPSPVESAATRLSGEFAGDKPLGNTWFNVAAGGGTLAAAKGLANRRGTRVVNSLADDWLNRFGGQLDSAKAEGAKALTAWEQNFIDRFKKNPDATTMKAKGHQLNNAQMGSLDNLVREFGRNFGNARLDGSKVNDLMNRKFQTHSPESVLRGDLLRKLDRNELRGVMTRRGYTGSADLNNRVGKMGYGSAFLASLMPWLLPKVLVPGAAKVTDLAEGAVR